MPLSSELVSQFAKLASNKPKEEKESTTYGTTVIQNGNKYVKLDGSELLTPASFTTNIADGERVTVLIKNHMAVVTGNITSPAARTSEVEEVGDKVDAAEAAVKDLTADNLKVNQRLEAQEGSIKNLTADNVTINGTLSAQEASIGDLKAENATISGKLEAAEGNISNLQADNVTINKSLTAAKASIEDLNTNKLSADQADIKYANIDFTNIGKAAIEQFYATSGIIKDLVIGDTSVTGKLVGVTIIGDLIEGGTVKADKLVVKGSDGLFYKLNTDGISITAEQTDYNSLNGSILTAKSVTAEKVNVKDLVAFDATIGGFHISDSSIYSGVKTAVDSPESGIYFDSEGQISFGDADNFIRYYKNTDGEYKLDISTAKIIQNSGSIDLLIKKVDSLEGECNGYTDKKLNDYVTASDYNSDKENTSHAMEDMTKTINSKANADDLSGYTPIADHNKILKYMKFDENGITIGSGISNDQGQGQGQNKNLTLNLDNDAIKFKNGEEVIGSWDGTNFYTGDIVIKLNQRAQFGNFAFVPRSDGSIMFLKVKD